MTMLEKTYDLCVIGGGINGSGIARDAAGRGLSVALLEADDLGGATSSASTKLIHGGLRYLEYYEFALVREALKEREILLSLAPHIIWPLRFILPHNKNLRPAWLIRLGLFLYDHLGGRKKLPASKAIRLKNHIAGKALKARYKKGFQYSDCWVEDSRLVVLNAMDAKDRGADILTRTKCTDIKAGKEYWRITTEKPGAQKTKEIKARMIVNAAGPWVQDILDDSGLAEKDTPGIRLVKGSHIIVRKIYEGDHAYILQLPDKRIIFAIPYEHGFTLIGTTEVDYDGDPRHAEIDQDEIDYLLRAINHNFKKQITENDIVHSYSGVRPLFDDGHGDAKAVTRGYRLDLDIHGGLPILSVFGGKITTYRELAEKAVNRLLDYIDDPRYPWTAEKFLPGGNFEDFDLFLKQQKEKHPDLPDNLIHRYARAYGTNMDKFAAGDLGRHYGEGLYEAEVRYLIQNEWAQTLDDILWRRSKLGLHLTDETKQNLKTDLPRLMKENL